jgi:hypothetical protein
MIKTEFMKLYEELGTLNDLELTIPNIKDPARLDADIQKLFGATVPGNGATFIASNGTFINLPDGMDVHVDLLYYLIDNHYIEAPANYDHPDATFEDPTELTDILNYIRCNNDLGGFAYITLPETLPTYKQFSSLEIWINTLSAEELEINTAECNKIYNLKENTAEDILKKIKRFFASGKFYD